MMVVVIFLLDDEDGHNTRIVVRNRKSLSAPITSVRKHQHKSNYLVLLYRSDSKIER